MARDPRAKLLKLLDARQELSEKMAAIDAEMRALVTGDEGIGDKLKRLCRHYSEVWETRYGTPYVFAFAKDMPQWKRLLRSMSADEIDARILSFTDTAVELGFAADYTLGEMARAPEQLEVVRRHPARALGPAAPSTSTSGS